MPGCAKCAAQPDCRRPAHPAAAQAVGGSGRRARQTAGRTPRFAPLSASPAGSAIPPRSISRTTCCVLYDNQDHCAAKYGVIWGIRVLNTFRPHTLTCRRSLSCDALKSGASHRALWFQSSAPCEFRDGSKSGRGGTISLSSDAQRKAPSHRTRLLSSALFNLLATLSESAWTPPRPRDGAWRIGGLGPSVAVEP